MTASSDGSIRIFQDYESRQTTSLLTAFNSTTRPDAHSMDFSLSMDWLQTRGEILTAGDSKSIRVWSAHTELLSNVSSRHVFAVQFSTDSIYTGNPYALQYQGHLHYVRPGSRQSHMCWLRRRCSPGLRSAGASLESNCPKLA